MAIGNQSYSMAKSIAEKGLDPCSSTKQWPVYSNMLEIFSGGLFWVFTTATGPPTIWSIDTKPCKCPFSETKLGKMARTKNQVSGVMYCSTSHSTQAINSETSNGSIIWTKMRALQMKILIDRRSSIGTVWALFWVMYTCGSSSGCK